MKRFLCGVDGVSVAGMDDDDGACVGGVLDRIESCMVWE